MAEINSDQGYRQATRNNVLLSRVIIALVMLLLVSVGGYTVLLPLKTTEWVIYEFSSTSNTFVRVAKADQTITANHALIKMMLRQYVMQREVVNHVDEPDRYASVMAQSNSEVGGAFQEVYGGKNSPLNRSDFVRGVVINRDSVLGTGLHQVEFTTTDTTRDTLSKPEVRHWVASIAYTWKSQDVRMDGLSINPAGLVITRYSLAPRSQ